MTESSKEKTLSSSSEELSTPLLPSYHLQDLPAANRLGAHDESGPSAPSTQHCEAHQHEPHTIDGRVTALTLAMIIFYNVTGGPFGIESSVKAAGNLYAIIGISLMPIIWATPEMYMTYRLSTLYPCASGGVLWLEKAFGPTASLVQGYLGWLGGVVNGATYPALLYEYIMSQFFADKGESEVNPITRYSLVLILTLLMSLINYRGLDIVGHASTLIYIISMGSFLVMTIIGIPKINPQKWLQTPDTGNVEYFDDDSPATNGWFPLESLAGIAMRPFINNLYWNFNNFDQAGHYSTSAPKKTFKRGLVASLFLCSSAYLIPVLVATGATDISQDDWKPGAFAVAGTQIAGRWLGNWIVVSTAICAIGAFCSELAADSMQLMGMADRAQIPSIFSHRSKYDTPSYSIVLCLIVVASVLPFEFGFIVELTNFAYCLSVTMEFMAFAKLQILNGDTSNLRKMFYVLMMVPPLFINVMVMLLASYAIYIYAAVVIALGLLLINAKCLSSSIRKCVRPRPGPGESVSDSSLNKAIA